MTESSTKTMGAVVVGVVDHVVLDGQVLAGDQHRTGLLSQVRVLEVGGVVAAGGEDDVDASGVDVVHGPLEELGVVPVVLHRVVLERRRGGHPGELPGDERVGGAGGDPEVVLQDVPCAVLCLDQVDAGYVAVDALGRDYTVALLKEPGGGEHELLRHDTVLDDALLAVDVRQEAVEGVDPLPEPLLQVVELLLGDDPGDGIEGEELLVELAVLVDAELDPVPCQETVHRLRLLE